MKTIKRFDLGSVFKMAAVTYGLLFALLGFFFLLLPSIIGFGLLRELSYEMGLGGMGASIIVVLIMYVVGIIVNALISGIIAVIAAILYNLVAGWVGGIRIELD